MLHWSILSPRDQMKIHNADATSFDTKAECQAWIDDRIVRFKLIASHGKDKNGKIVVGALQKTEGRILNKTIEGFKEQAYDEPLTNYAEPVKEDDKWLAVMQVRG